MGSLRFHYVVAEKLLKKLFAHSFVLAPGARNAGGSEDRPVSVYLRWMQCLGGLAGFYASGNVSLLEPKDPTGFTTAHVEP